MGIGGEKEGRGNGAESRHKGKDRKDVVVNLSPMHVNKLLN
jgi:hypothetical protein